MRIVLISLIALLAGGDALASSLYLPHFQLVVPMPEGDDGIWSSDPSSKENEHLLVHHKAKTVVVFEVEPVGNGCAAKDANFEKVGWPATAVSELGLGEPYFGTSRSAVENGTLHRTACADVGGLELYVYTGMPEAQDPVERAAATRLITAVGTAFREHTLGHPPVVTFPFSGLRIEVVGGDAMWQMIAGKGTEGVKQANTEANVFGVLKTASDRTCESEVGALGTLGTSMLDDTSFLPAGWSHQVANLGDGATPRLLTCMPTRTGGVIELTWSGVRPSNAPVIRPLLEAFVRAYGIAPAAPPPPPPPEPAAAPPVVATAEPAPSPYVPDVPASSSTSDDADPVPSGYVSAHYVSFGFQQLEPAAVTTAPKATAGVLALVQPSTSITEDLSLSYEGAVALTYDDHSAIGLAGRIGVGYPLALGRLLFVPAIGFGFDYLGNGDAGAYGLDAALNLYGALTVRLRLSDGLTITARGAKILRSGPIDESELVGDLVYTRMGHRKIVLEGFVRSYDGMPQASVVGGGLGVGF